MNLVKNKLLNISRSGVDSTIGINQLSSFTVVSGDYVIFNLLKPMVIDSVMVKSTVDVNCKILSSGDGINYKNFSTGKAVFIKIEFTGNYTISEIEINSEVTLNIDHETWKRYKYLELGDSLPEIFVDTDIQKMYKIFLKHGRSIPGSKMTYHKYI